MKTITGSFQEGKPKIGIVVNQFPTPSETFIVTKVLGLVENGMDVEIFCAMPSPHWDNFRVLSKENTQKIHINISPLGYRRHFWHFLQKLSSLFFRKFFLNPRKFFILFRLVRIRSAEIGLPWISQFIYKLMFLDKKIDILHIEFDFQAYGLLDLKEFLGCKVVLSGRGSIERTSIPFRYPKFYNYIYNHVDCYHFISKYLLTEAYAKGMKLQIPVHLIEPAIDLSLFQPSKPQKTTNKIQLITVARLSWAKGHEFGMDAIAIVRLKHPNIEYVLIGEGEFKEAIHYAAFQHNLVSTGVVHFVGNVKRESIKSFLDEADIMIHPALEEGFCNAVIEAQAMEIPVVCSDAGGLPENVENGVTGFVVPRRDAKAMADKIIYLIENPEIRLKMGAAGRKRVIEKFDIKNQAKAFNTMYLSLMNGFT